MFGLDSNRYERCCQVVVDSVENCSQQSNPRANGAKRRSGRKPGARVTNFVLAELKVVAARGS